MNNSRNPKSGCFSTVLRRLLCSGGPQTHPSDLYQPDFGSDEKTGMLAADESAAPGIVARLMGLDSFPGKVSVSEDPARVSRSKSVNFIDYLLELDVTEARHRRYRTSVSFREVPSKQLQEKQGQELLLIYLENGVGEESSAEQVVKERKCEEEEVLKKEERKNNKISKLKDEPRRRRRRRRRRGVREKMEKRKEEMCRVGRTKSKEIVGGRKAESEAADDHLLISNSKKQWSFDSAKSAVKDETDSLVESLGNLRKLTEEDIESENWRREMSEMINGEEVEEICGGLEGQILQVMLDQVADELLGIW